MGSISYLGKAVEKRPIVRHAAQEVFSVGEAVEKPVAEITVKGRVAQEVFGQLADDHLSPRAGRIM
jgi:hypothetical protein